MYYVTCNDSFFSGWGKADNKINKLIFECASLSDARCLADWIGSNREEMKYINISSKPKLLRKTFGSDYYIDNYFVQIKNSSDMPEWYKKAGIFKEEKGI